MSTSPSLAANRSTTPIRAWLRGAGGTAFGRHEGRDTIDLMDEAVAQALASSGLRRADIDGVICGYATTLPHLMLSTLVCEQAVAAAPLCPRPATGRRLGHGHGDGGPRTGPRRSLSPCPGDRRRESAQRFSRATARSRPRPGGRPRLRGPERRLGAAYYALMASAYLQETGVSTDDLAELAVLMRRHASAHPGAHLRTPINVDEVRASRHRLVAAPAGLLSDLGRGDGPGGLGRPRPGRGRAGPRGCRPCAPPSTPDGDAGCWPAAPPRPLAGPLRRPA